MNKILKAELIDTENSSEHLAYNLSPGTPAVIAFTGMASGLNELANFEFVKTIHNFPFSKIFVRDPHFSFYHKGIDSTIKSIPALSLRLSEILREGKASRVACVGVSAGGYAALLMGHLLKVTCVHAFGPQTILYRQWGLENDDPTIYNCEVLHSPSILPEEDFRDLKKVLAVGNGITKHYVHIGKSDCDERHAINLQGIPNVEIVRYDCEGHACASHVLKKEGRLGNLIYEALQC